MSQVSVPVITVDGPGGAGKGTLCQLLSRQLGWHLLDSGALYRLVAMAAEDAEIAFDNAAELTRLARDLDAAFQPGADGEPTIVLLGGVDVSGRLRLESTGDNASVVAAIPAVREALLQRQKDFAQSPGLVADGRDMGTVVFPGAMLKVFLTASAEERATRRYNQLMEKGESVNLAALLSDIKERDARDEQRSVSPLKPAEDAVVVDTSGLGIEAVFTKVLALAGARTT